jgi:DNA polymerase (family X)
MDNSDIADLFKLYSRLLDLHDGNPFKVKSYASASYNIDKLGVQLESMPGDEMAKLEVLGKGLSSKVEEILATGSFEELNDLLAITPQGVLDILKINGLGPKKVKVIWKELGIESVGDLLYACQENRLANAKGFGLKTQESVQRSIEFASLSSGKFHFYRIEDVAETLKKHLEKDPRFQMLSLTGAVRRKCEILEIAELVCGYKGSKEDIAAQLEGFDLVTSCTVDERGVSGFVLNHFPFSILHCLPESFASVLFESTGSPAHLDEIGYKGGTLHQTEEDIYKALGLSFIEPELREGLGESRLAMNGEMPKLLSHTELKGILHNHTTYSDGLHTLKEMAEHCKKEGYQYLGICDHSKSAFYAGGLSIERVLEQQREIDDLNKKLAPFKVFKGIESDILHDGSLDYPDDILKTFDFIVASVHSNLKMPEDKATARLIKAIENPYTTILGHPTGRLLLIRSGYPIDHKKVIDACAANGVVMEVNANPYRLDIDWRWVRYCMEKGVMLSINPDAHSREEYANMYYGVCASRKGGLTREMTFNALSLEEIEQRFAMRKNSVLTA